MSELVVTGFDTVDVRFATSLESDGSDAMNPDPDYSAAYVILHTNAPELASRSGDGINLALADIILQTSHQ